MLSAVTPDAKHQEHDHQANTGFSWSGIQEKDDANNKWDRARLMSYVDLGQSSMLPTEAEGKDRDRVYLCGKRLCADAQAAEAPAGAAGALRTCSSMSGISNTALFLTAETDLL